MCNFDRLLTDPNHQTQLKNETITEREAKHKKIFLAIFLAVKEVCSHNLFNMDNNSISLLEKWKHKNCHQTLLKKSLKLQHTILIF
jgi:hypothetical protein